jgi:phage terminase large subunit-like protein
MLELVAAKVRYLSQHRILIYFNDEKTRASYPKQIQFFNLTAENQEVALFGGNRSGKTVAGTYADAVHLTGEYPSWWRGYRFDHPTEVWAASDTGKSTRDILQSTLCGKYGDESAKGTGMIPGDLILRTTPKHGIPDAYETVYVRHVPTGGVSTLQFKSYDQGREAFQGTAIDVIHLDEEPDIEIYTECLLRLMTRDGRLMLTATPLRGVTALMLQYLPHLAPKTMDELEENYDEEPEAVNE